MLAIDVAELPAHSPVSLVAHSSSSLPDFILADRTTRARVVAARWHRREVRLDGPIDLEQHLLSYCEQGGGLCTIVGQGRRLHAQQHAGSVTFLPAGRYESWRLQAPGEVAHLHLYIAPEALSEARRLMGGVPLPMAPLMAVHVPWFDAFFRLLSAEYEACRAAGRLEALDLVDRMGGRLLERLLELQRQASSGKEATHRVPPLRPSLLRAVTAHVDAHLSRRIGLDELATLVAMSVDHFVRVFEEATGTTPHRWILERRLDAACGRLRGTTDRIEQIARDCGFGGAAHFAAAFRRHRGVTPSVYRRGN